MTTVTGPSDRVHRVAHAGRFTSIIDVHVILRRAGRVLLLRVNDIMRTGPRLPLAADTVSTQEAILAMTKARSNIWLRNAKKSTCPPCLRASSTA